MSNEERCGKCGHLFEPDFSWGGSDYCPNCRSGPQKILMDTYEEAKAEFMRIPGTHRYKADEQAREFTTKIAKEMRRKCRY